MEPSNFSVKKDWETFLSELIKLDMAGVFYNMVNSIQKKPKTVRKDFKRRRKMKNSVQNVRLQSVELVLMDKSVCFMFLQATGLPLAKLL